MRLSLQFPPLRRGILLLLGVIAILALPARPLDAQLALFSAREAFEQARSDYRRGVEARDAIRTLQQRAVDAVGPARNLGQRQLSDALATAHAMATNLSGAERNLSRRRDELRRAGEELLDQLDGLVAALEANLRNPSLGPSIIAGATDALQQTRAEITDVEAALREIEQTVAPIEIILVQWDLRNGPQDYLNQAQINEGKVRTYEDLIAETEDEIRRAVARRAIEDELSSQARFPSNPAGGRTSVGASMSNRDLLDERIAIAREIQADYVRARDAHRREAQRARAYAEGRGP